MRWPLVTRRRYDTDMAELRRYAEFLAARLRAEYLAERFERQEQRVVDRRSLVLEYIRSVPYSPTVREIMEAVGLTSPSPVQKHLDRLEADGLIGRGGPEHDRIYAIRREQDDDPRDLQQAS